MTIFLYFYIIEEFTLKKSENRKGILKNIFQYQNNRPNNINTESMNKFKGQASINLKLSENLKQRTKEKADLKQQTVSKYIRELLVNYFDGTLCISEMAKNQRKEFINSTEFLQLIVWMYSIRKLNKFKETQEELEGYISTLKKTQEHFPKNLVSEFDKVLLDLIRIANETSKYSKKDYKFADGYTSNPEFNFELLENYLFSYEK